MSRSLVDDNAEKRRFCSIKELYMYIHTYIHMYLCIYPSCSSARHFVHYHSSWGHFLLEINTLGLCPGKGFSDIPSCWGNPTSRGLLKKKESGKWVCWRSWLRAGKSPAASLLPMSHQACALQWVLISPGDSQATRGKKLVELRALWCLPVYVAPGSLDCLKTS